MNNRSWFIGLIFGLTSAILMTIIHSVERGAITTDIVMSSLLGGLMGGFLYAWMMDYSVKKVLDRIRIEKKDNENIIHERAANYLTRKEAVGGKLVLTDKRLIFKSHRYNIQNHQVRFGLNQIKKLQVTKTLGVLENGLMLELITNDRRKFILDKPSDWMEKILDQQRGSH